MKRQLKILLISLLMASSIFNFTNRTSFPVANATYVEGPITKDTVWTLVESPFVVSGEIIVYPGVMLTIEPGVEVMFGGSFSLTISGKMYANGTDKPITFTSNREQPEAGDWKAIIFAGTEKSVIIGCAIAYAENGTFIENGNVEIRNATINLCQNGVTVSDGKLAIFNSTISSCYQNGIKITGNGQVIIQENTIIGNGNGILLTGNEISGVNISHNKISANRQCGIKIDVNNHIDVTILNNIVSSNEEGIYVSTPTNMHIANNSISYNKFGILYDEGNHTADYNDIYSNEIGMDVLSGAFVNAEHNYWGDESGPYHESLNPRGTGNPVGGDGVNLDFIFYLTKPIGYINMRPTAILLTDKILVPPDEDVMLFATNSFDEDGRIDMYFFDFGDGSNSGWTTLSILTHKYPLYNPPLQMYNTTLVVVDDYGTSSESVNLTINVQNLPSLQISLGLSNSRVQEGEHVSVMVHVTNGTAVMENATIAIFSVKGGTFTESLGFTNASGYFVTTFIAPDVTKIANVRIVARASRIGYSDGSDYAYVEILPFLSVEITADRYIIKSEEKAHVSIHVKSNEEPIANASVSISSSGGSLSLEKGFTNLNGIISLVFTAPQTTTFLNVIITATAMKEGYMNGAGQMTIAILPKILSVQITAKSSDTISDAKLNLTVHVEYDMISIAEANVTVVAENGNFSKNTELTNNYGNVTFTFIAPSVNEQTNITITARATKVGYAEGQSQLKMLVNPRTFKIQIITPAIESEDLADVIVDVKCNEDLTSVAGATVVISSSNGAFPITTKTTDTTGVCTFTFDAPKTSAPLSVVITVNVTKNGYVKGGNQTVVTVNPKTSEGEGGWTIATILLIIIPIVIAVVIVILIKLKIIVVSVKEEE